jgi:hypothetical protein
MGWPKYAQYCWMATFNNGLAATAYGPSIVRAKVANGENITIKEETNYPFEEQIRFVIEVGKEVSFPLELRIPSWCAAPVIKLNGIVQKNVIPGTYHSIFREWKNGDTVVLDLPMEIKISKWVNNSVGIERGPLVYSLKMDEDWKKLNSHVFNGTDFSEYEVFPKNAWNYGLIINEKNPSKSIEVIKGNMTDNPFNQGTTPILLKVKARKINSWGLDANGVHAAEPPFSPVSSDNPIEEIILVPFGAERIRLTYFPVIGKSSPQKETVFKDGFLMGDTNNWINFGGSWQQQNGKYYAHSTGVKGVKSVATATHFTDFIYDVTVTIPDDNAQAGILFRVNNPSDGTDTYQGYYVGLSTNGQIILGKSDNSWTEIKRVNAVVNKAAKYHLRVTAKGAEIKVYADDMNNPKIVAADSTFHNGAIGLRGYGGETIIFENLIVKPY